MIVKKDLAEVVICGAGIAGISAAYYLSVKQGVKDILLVDERAPFSLTSDKSTECYRNWWPGPGDAMVKFMNRSIDLMEGLAQESGNRFHMNRRGYLFVTAEHERIAAFKKAAEQPCALGAGLLRIHDCGSTSYQPSPAQGYENLPTGADLILDPGLIKQYFPFLDNKVVAALHVRRCGWMSAQQLAMYMLEQAKEAGTRFQTARVEDIEVQENQVQAVLLTTESGLLNIDTHRFVNAAGPFVKQMAAKLAVDLPVFCELHDKISFNDYLSIIPQNAPLTFWADPQRLPWSDEERKLLEETATTKWLLEPFPS
ncbi:MAG: FAD-dependent oxidoreductase, partial [Candidatus Aminicenantes bacterium]|nr:FAD-dependent oxidoreductase [Candidatus Aminicenantes bacterium]